MVWFVLPRLIASGMTLVIMILFFRMLGPADFGRYNFILVSGTMLHAYVFSWIDAALMRFHRAPEFEHRLESISLGLSGLMALALGLGCIGLLLLDPAMDGRVTVTLVVLFCLAHLLHELGTTFLRLYGRRRAYAAAILIRPLVAVGLGAALILAGYGWVAVVGAAVAGACVAGLVSMAPFAARRPSLPDAATLSTLLGYGVPLAIIRSYLMGLLLISQALLLYLQDTAAVGLFAAAQVLCFRSVGTVMNEVSKALAPKIFSTFEQEGKMRTDETLKHYLSILLLMSVPITAPLIFANHTVARVLFDDDLAAGVARQLPWLAGAAFGITFQGAFLSYAFTISRTTFRQLLMICGFTALHLGFSALGVWWAGALGAAVAMSATAGAMLGLTVLFGHRAYRMPLLTPDVWKMLIGILVFVPWGIAADHVMSLTLALAVLAAGGAAALSTLYLLDYDGFRRLPAARHDS